MAKSGSSKVADPKNKGTGLCDYVITDAKGNKKKFKVRSTDVTKKRTSSNGAPRKNFIFGRDKYAMHGPVI